MTQCRDKERVIIIIFFSLILHCKAKKNTGFGVSLNSWHFSLTCCVILDKILNANIPPYPVRKKYKVEMISISVYFWDESDDVT